MGSKSEVCSFLVDNILNMSSSCLIAHDSIFFSLCYTLHFTTRPKDIPSVDSAFVLRYRFVWLSPALITSASPWLAWRWSAADCEKCCVENLDRRAHCWNGSHQHFGNVWKLDQEVTPTLPGRSSFILSDVRRILVFDTFLAYSLVIHDLVAL